MPCLLQILGLVLSGLLFSLALAVAEPYPAQHATYVFCISIFLFISIGLLISNLSKRKLWILYGVSVFLCYLVAAQWSSHFGNWYPPVPPIVELFRSVDGESAHDAMVTNLFLVLWLVLSIAFLFRYLTNRSTRTLPPPANPSSTRSDFSSPPSAP